MTGPHLFIDGRNCAYRAIYAGLASAGRASHPFVVMLRFMQSWLKTFKPASVSVFWDAPRHTVWRRRLMPGYKARASTKGRPDVGETMAGVQAAALATLAHLNVRQFGRAEQEADDLIYAACRVVHPADVVIVSSDGDFGQIAWATPTVRVYEPRLNKLMDRPALNPVTRKALMGDPSDCIDGFTGIGPVKSAAIAESVASTMAFLDKADVALYLRNVLLIDLALCPDLLANQMYVARVLAGPVAFDQRAAIDGAIRHRAADLVGEAGHLLPPFKHIGETAQADREA